MKVVRILLLVTAASMATAAIAQAGFSISPAHPGPMDFIQVTKPYGDENPLATTTSMSGKRITVQLQNYLMYFPEVGPPTITVDLGRLPAGDYQVEVILNDPGRGTTQSLGVQPLQVAARIPGQPIDEYSDIWWNPAESGWGLNIAQHASGQLFATWFVYAADGTPQWYVMPGGAWRGGLIFEGDIYRTSGPEMARFSAAAVTRAKVGTATLVFLADGHMFADFTVDGVRTQKTLERQPF